MEWSGQSYELWQEYSLFFSLPVSRLGFVVVNFFGEPRGTIADFAEENP